MNWLEHLLTPTLVRAVGYTILHSLWQGAVVALALAGLLFLLRRHTPQVRYSVTAGALALVVLLAAVTFARYYFSALPEVAISTGEVLPMEASVADATAAPAAQGPLNARQVLLYLEQHLPLLVTLWLLGMLAMTLRLLGGLAYVQRLRHYGTNPLGAAWQERLALLADRAGLRRPVQLLESSMVRVPVVVGHLKPVILLPLGAVAGLSAAQLEAILAHELAHVVRRDYLVNLLQSVAETLLFYHPAVWFLTATLRSERENCCDDVAASLCGNPLVLARALAALAELGLDRAVAPRLTMAAVGPKGSLLSRVTRLVQGRTAPTFSEGFMAACVVIMGLVLLSFSAVAALANPRLAAEAPRLLRSSVLKPLGAALAPFTEPDEPCLEELDVPLPPPAPLAAAPEDDDDKRKRKIKRKNKGSTQVVVVDRHAPVARRGGAGTVIIEKDKKGRLTELYVNGQRVETSDDDRRGGKARKDERVRVIQVPSGSNWTVVAPPAPGFHFEGRDFDQRELRESMARLKAEMKQNEGQWRALRLAPEAYVYRDGAHAEHIAAEALRSAERSLEKARLSGELTEDERERLDDELERLRERRQEVEAARRETDAQRRESEARRREADAQRREADAKRREELAKAREERARERERRTREIEEKLINELRKDGLISDVKNFTFVLTSSRLTVNGKEQPADKLSKYLGIFKELYGKDMGPNSSFTITENGTNSSRIITSNSNDAPPAAPRPPRAPRIAGAPTAPRPPRAPGAPRSTMLNGVDLRAELLKDKIIGEDDRNLQFQLNNGGMTVNGKKQSGELADKYRKLLGGKDGDKVNINLILND